MSEEDRRTFKLTFKDQRRIINKEITLLDLVVEKEKEIERLNKIRQQVIDELFELKDMIYKPETREINFDVQNKISSIIKILGSDKD